MNRRPKRTVAIVVPVSAQLALTPEEEVSIRHLCHYLGRYDKYLIAPSGSQIRREGFGVVHYAPKFFGSAAAHASLLMWPGFYRRFLDYEYILMHHLDSLVFSDELMRWCRTGLDFIGAPWIPCADTPWVNESRVGNGGFSLMKVESVLQALSNRHRQEPLRFWSDFVTRNDKPFRPAFVVLEQLRRIFPGWTFVNRLLEFRRRGHDPAAHGLNNDFFLSTQAARYLPTFKVATVEQGLRFAFEAAPRVCFELNKRQLPFGCHAWAKYDPTFWEPHLLRPEAAARHERTAAVARAVYAAE